MNEEIARDALRRAMRTLAFDPTWGEESIAISRIERRDDGHVVAFTYRCDPDWHSQYDKSVQLSGEARLVDDPKGARVVSGTMTVVHAGEATSARVGDVVPVVPSFEGVYTRDEATDQTLILELSGDRFRLEHHLGGEWGSNETIHRGTWFVDDARLVLSAEESTFWSYTAVDDEPSEQTTPSDETFTLEVVTNGFVLGATRLRKKE